MSAALKHIPIFDQAKTLSEKPRLGKKRCKPVLVWKNSKLSARMHKEKSKAKLRCASGGSIYIYVHNNPLLYTDPSGLAVPGCSEMFQSSACYEPLLSGPSEGPDPILQATFEYGITVGAFIPSPVQPLFAYGSTAVVGKNIYNALSQGNGGEAFVQGAPAAMQESGNPWVRGTGFLFEAANYARTISGIPPVDDTYREIMTQCPRQ